VRDVCRGHVTVHDENLPGMGRGKSSASTLEKEHIQSERKASPDSPNVKENILKPRSVRSVYERGQWMMGSTAARDSITTEEASCTLIQLLEKNEALQQIVSVRVMACS